MSIFKAIKFVKKPIDFKESPDTVGATTNLGSRSPKSSDRICISRSFAVNINIDTNVDGFKESVEWQRDYIKKKLACMMPLIQHLELHHEDTAFYKRKSSDDPFVRKTDAKLHWHGLIVFFKKYSRIDYTKIFKEMGQLFAVEKRTCHVAVNYKKIKDGKHLTDRRNYQMKQNSIPMIKKTYRI